MPLFPVDEVEALLLLRAGSGTDISYGELFRCFDLPFQRFQVGHLCAALADVDRLQAARGHPELAVLVVRQSDRLPGQGWWVGRPDWKGRMVGPEAAAFVRGLQRAAFRFWAAPAVEPGAPAG